MNITIIDTGRNTLCDWGCGTDSVRMQLSWEGVNKVANWTNAPGMDTLVGQTLVCHGRLKSTPQPSSNVSVE